MTTLLELGDERFVSLTTFRRNGVGVSTPVWIVRDGDGLSVTTPAEAGKVKRLRNNSRVELRPCSRSGKVADDAPTVVANAELLPGKAADDHARELVRAKYGAEYQIFMVIEKLASRGKNSDRLAVRITER